MRYITALVFAIPTLSEAQTPTPEELLALIDKRASDLGPYTTLLEDPDPLRQALAVEALLATGDPRLVPLAIDVGLRASDSRVRQTTLEQLLETDISLTIEIGAEGVEDEEFEETIRKVGGAANAGAWGAVTYAVGTYDVEKGCYLHSPPFPTDVCLVRISPGRIQITANYVGSSRTAVQFSGELNVAGTVVGQAVVDYVSGALPAIIRFLP